MQSFHPSILTPCHPIFKFNFIYFHLTTFKYFIFFFIWIPKMKPRISIYIKPDIYFKRIIYNENILY